MRVENNNLQFFNFAVCNLEQIPPYVFAKVVE